MLRTDPGHENMSIHYDRRFHDKFEFKIPSTNDTFILIIGIEYSDIYDKRYSITNTIEYDIGEDEIKSYSESFKEL